jgi:glutathione-specific gamma-glutamylcyclotransferase
VAVTDTVQTPARLALQNRHRGRDPAHMLETVRRQWGGKTDLWIFGYASLIWRPEFEFSEERFATIHGYHRALKMWSRVNRGTPECPGLVFGLLRGGSCKGLVYRIPQARVAAILPGLWEREMPTGVYDPRWLRCQTPQGKVAALAFTLSKRSPNHTGALSEDSYRKIFSDACGRYGTTREYAQLTYDKLRALGIHDHALEKLLRLVKP